MIEFQGQESEFLREQTDGYREEKSRRSRPPRSTRVRSGRKRGTVMGGICRRKNRRWAW